MGGIGGSRTKGLSSPTTLGFQGRATHLAGEGYDPPPTTYTNSSFLIFFFFTAPPLKPSSLSLLLSLLLFFRLAISPPLTPLPCEVVLLLGSTCYGGRGGGAEEYSSTLTPNITAMLTVNFFVRSFAFINFLECPTDTLFWANFIPKPPPPMPFLSISYLSSLSTRSEERRC